MTTSYRPPNASLSLESAANRVFRVAELVSLILQEFASAQVAPLATVTSVFQSECERRLYKWLKVTTSEGVNSRLRGLIQAVEVRPELPTSLTIKQERFWFPAEGLLQGLFINCIALTTLVTEGKLSQEWRRSQGGNFDQLGSHQTFRPAIFLSCSTLWAQSSLNSPTSTSASPSMERISTSSSSGSYRRAPLFATSSLAKSSLQRAVSSRLFHRPVISSPTSPLPPPLHYLPTA
jgi:hypothetical protein